MTSKATNPHVDLNQGMKSMCVGTTMISFNKVWIAFSKEDNEKSLTRWLKRSWKGHLQFSHPMKVEFECNEWKSIMHCIMRPYAFIVMNTTKTWITKWSNGLYTYTLKEAHNWKMWESWFEVRRQLKYEKTRLSCDPCSRLKAWT